MAAKAIAADAATKAAKQKEYNALCAEDAQLIALLNSKPYQLPDRLNKSNQKWAEFLKKSLKVEDLPENKPAKVFNQNPASSFISTLFDAVTALFTGMVNAKDNNYRAPMLAFSAMMIPVVLNLFGSIFKPLLGGNAVEKIQGFTKAVTDFFMKELSEEPDAPGGAGAAPGGAGAAPAPAVARSKSSPAIIPGKKLADAKALPLATMAAPVTPVASPESSVLENLGGIAKTFFGFK